MEGLLLVPPDRTALIGRLVWKPRYLVFGLVGSLEHATTSSSSHKQSRKGSLLKTSSHKPSLTNINQTAKEKDNLVLSIYKQKGDQEPIQQYPLSRLKSIDIQTIQHPKKAGHATPTLIIHLEVDAAAEKLRKRRSSRTSGLTSSSTSNVLHFRSVENERHNIYNWQATIQQMLQLEDEELQNDDHGEIQKRRLTNPPSMPMSPLSPTYSPFSNPFPIQRPTTSSANRPNMPQARGSDHTFNNLQSTRERQVISPDPSLRSKRSDLSSQASSQQKPFGSVYYSSTLPSTSSDLPSPNSAYDDQEAQFVEGWTAAQGLRSGSLTSTHTRNSNSISSPPTANCGTNTASSPIPRESILDRAFQMRYIPGSDNMSTSSKTDEKELSSIARFEALMRKVDEEKAREKAFDKLQSQKSGWELDEESEEGSDMDGDVRKGNMIMDEEIDPLTKPRAEIPTPAQRALDYISGRVQSHHHSPQTSISPLSPPPPFQHYHERPYSSTTRTRTQTVSIIDKASYHEGVRFQDSFETASGRPSMSRQSSNQSQRSGHRRTKSSRPTSLALPSRTLIAPDPDFIGPFSAGLNLEKDRPRSGMEWIDRPRSGMERSHTTGNINRLSTNSPNQPPSTSQDNSKKRLSFGDFTRRLSSTSSLLLAQTNTNLSGSSSRVSSDSSSWIDALGGELEGRGMGGLRHSAIVLPREGYGGAMGSRDGMVPSRDEKRCGWRGSVGVFGSEGGFL